MEPECVPNTVVKSLIAPLAFFCSDFGLFGFFPLEAILSCKHKFSKGMSLRIEWKKIQSQGVSFVYYKGEFTGRYKTTNLD